MAGKQLTAQEITDLLTATPARKKKDTSEPRTTDNWWHQESVFIFRPDFPDVETRCGNPNCADPRDSDKTIILANVKGALICRYCFLSGYLSDAN